MKIISFFLCIFVLGLRITKEMNYTASTPAGKTVRAFLGISQTDSIDFIRWDLKIENGREFRLSCRYGIGRPNTNGFIDEKKAEAKGSAHSVNGVLTLKYNGRPLSLLVLNSNILHILDEDGKLLVGNGGWSYTLNSTEPVHTTEIHLKPEASFFKDSLIVEGRTPCRYVEEMLMNKTRPECYKKKWLIFLYRSGTAASGTYKFGPGEDRRGKWRLKEDKTGKIIYSLDLNNGNTLDLLRADENIIYIMDGKGGLLVGDLNFSYSLNRRKG